MGLFYYLFKWNRIPASVALGLALVLSGSTQAQLNITNSRPTLDPIANDTTNFSPDIRYIELNGITPGEEADQQVSIAVATHDTDLVKSIGADLVDNGKAFINYQVREGAAGTATVKVVVTDNGATPSSFIRTFHITIEALNRELAPKSSIEASSLLKAIPNPALVSTRIFFSTPHDEEIATVDLYTLSGAKIKQLFTGNMAVNRSYSVDVDVKNLASGVYVVRLTGQSQTSNLKLVVAK
jgi:hypothetical protein